MTTPTDITSSNWSGAVIAAGSGESFSTISAQWLVPTVAQVPINGVMTSDLAEWVGIDGYLSADVCQAGVLEIVQTSANGQTTVTCEAFDEWYPAYANIIPASSFQVNPGDTIAVTVETSGAGATAALFILDDETTGQTYERNLTAPSGTSLQGNSAEFVVETPEWTSGDQVSQPLLSDFLNSPVVFHGVSATYSGGSAASLSSAQSIGMWTEDLPGSNGYAQEAYGSIQPTSDSLTVTEDDYWPSVNAPPPASTTAVIIMSNPSNGDYEIYNIGGNQVLAAYPLGQVSSPLSFVGLGTFQGGDTSDMLLRNTSTDQFEAYYISGNTVTGTANVGTVGTEWNIAGIGDFDGQSSLSELLLRNSGSGAFELYQVAGGGVLSGSSAGAVGNNFTVEGFGHFSESETTQMLMQDNSGDTSSGQLELYTYQSSTASFAGIDVGDIGSNLTFLGCGDLLGNGSTQTVMQQNNGDLWLYTYNPSANALSGTEVGAVGSNFQVVGFGPLGTSSQDEMLMQDSAGDFEIYQYNASENAFVGSAMGAVGSPWVVDGIVGTDPPASGASAASASTALLVQAMASMSNGAGLSSASNSTAGSEIATPTLLTTPQHA